MAFNPTKEQSLAMTEKGNVIVAAAAGSGKTAVLVERVIGMLNNDNNPIDADRLLIVTFTNAAAAEMRGRIEKRLGEECIKQPDNIRLLKQKHLISSAKICTIDSFCIDLIRENFEKAGVNPDFTINDENAVYPFVESVFSEMVGEYLQNNDPVFRDVLDITNSEFDESNFTATVYDIFRYSRQMPFPNVFLENLYESYKVDFSEKHPWFIISMDNVSHISEELLSNIDMAFELADNAGYADKFSTMLDDMREQISEINYAAIKNEWNTVYLNLRKYKRMRAPTVKGSKDISELVAVKSIYESVDDKVEKLQNLFFADFETIEKQLKRLRKPMKFLVDFVQNFAQRLFERQCKENVFTFYNTEQLALSMLCEYHDNEIHIKDDASQFLDRFDEILVDEYQDTNDLQDMLFRVLSDNERKLFVVGDVKQSIYAFRGANPNNFLNKKNRATDVFKADGEGAKKIILKKNFRSREGVCDYVNFFFKNFMTEQTGKIIYNSEEELVAGASFPEYSHPCVELLINDNIKSPEADESNHLVQEARRIAAYIKDVLNEGLCIRETENSLRPAKYSDFAILLRSTKNKSAIIANELRSCGIPVTFSQEEFLETYEIVNFKALLDIIDNPDNDISLLTVLMSPIFGFTGEEMAKIRCENKRGSLLSAVIKAAKNGDKKALDFLDKIDYFRCESVIFPLPRLLTKILSDTDYLNIVSSMPDGMRKKANLQLFVTYAVSYNETTGGGLGGFLKYLENLPEGALAAAKTGGSGETVKIMSMHASKGLQFPICILANTINPMHNSGAHKSYLYSEYSGLGFKYYEETIKEKTSSLGYEILSLEKKQQRLEEELRLLYVAMTRAEERLVMVASTQNLCEKLTSLSSALLTCEKGISSSVFSSVSSMCDWILMSALLHDDCVSLRETAGIPLLTHNSKGKISIKIVDASELKKTEYNDLSNEDLITVDNQLYEEVIKNISYEYPYSKLRDIEAKSTVSKLANQAENERFAFVSTPSFMQKDGLNAAGRGTATHKVMQFINFTEKVDVDLEIERLEEWQFISSAEANAIDRDALKKFFESKMYKRILSSEKFEREKRFLTEIKAVAIQTELPEHLGSETVMVQGAVDLCLIEHDGIVILDFKTDRVSSVEELKNTYSEQLNIYALACEKIYSLPVKEKVIYSFCLNDVISW